MKNIIFTRPDGGISVVTPSKEHIDKYGESAEGLSILSARSVPSGSSGETVMDNTEIPTDRTFRNAWKHTNGSLHVDMPQARDIHMNKIRKVRNDELKKEDVNFQRALESDDVSIKAAVIIKKQELRDIPQTFDLTVADTPEALSALWPTDLPKD